MNKNVLIVNYNTNKLTQSCIKSVNKHTPGCKIYVFDNSDKEPFVNIFDNVKVIDNTKGQIINFDEWLKKYPNKNSSGGRLNKWGSAKHCYTIQKFMDMVNEPFVLLDSDVLIKKDFSDLFDEKYVYVSEIRIQGNSTIKRVIPFICFINTKLCKENNIHYFNENRMHGLCKRDVYKNGDHYDTGSNFYLEAEKLEHREIKCDDYIVHFGSASWKSKSISAEKWLMLYKNLYMNMEKNKKVVYTCISGNYDTLIEPEFVTEGYDYICFTDQPFTSNTWEIRPIPSELNGLTAVKKQRNIKINAHKYLSDYEFSVWVDANTRLTGNINDFVSKNCNKELAVLYVGKHPQRDCIYKEGDVCVKLKKDTKENIEKQLNVYKKEGFPEHYGLPQTCILLRYHNEESCKKLMETWWEQVKDYSHRDQLSFNYALWKNQETKIKYLDKSIFNCSVFKWGIKHKKPVFKTEEKTIELKKPTTVIKESKGVVFRKPDNSSVNTPEKKRSVLADRIRQIKVTRQSKVTTLGDKYVMNDY